MTVFGVWVEISGTPRPGSHGGERSP